MKPQLAMSVAAGSVSLWNDSDANGNRVNLSAAERKTLLERVRGGEAIALRFDATTFIQNDGPNRNFVRFRDGALLKLARSFKGQPFLRDHNKGKVKSRGGTILESKLERDDGESRIVMTVEAVKPWAVEGLLDGTIDRFSIGAIPTGDMTCSVHKTPVFEECRCWPGDKVGDSDARVEFVIGDADGVEVSGVNVPAVVGTEVEDIRAALQAFAAAGGMSRPAQQEEPKMWKKVLALLGLNESASEDAAVAALEVVLAERKTAREASTHVTTLEAELAVLRASQVDHHIEQLYAEGRLPVKRDAKGDRIATELETALRGMASKVSFKAMQEYASSLPVIAPIGPRALETALGAGAAGTPAPSDPVSAYALASNISPDVLSTVMADAGVTPEMLAASGPRRQKGA